MKKLLMIAYAFPPSADVGTYRPVKFAKYLPEFGWSPVVLTVSNGKHGKYDERLLDIVPDGVQVYRSASLELLNSGESAKKHGRTDPRTFSQRVFDRISSIWAYFSIPDNKIGWVPSATIKAWRIVKKEGIEHVFITGKPFSSFLIGLLLKKLCGIRLIVDYRDPWTQNITYVRRSALHRWIDRSMERAVVHASDAVIANTLFNEGMLVDEFGKGERREKFLTIHNGYDGEDFTRVGGGRYDKFTITYAGAFYFSADSSFKTSAGDDVMKTYSPFCFFEALKQLVDNRPEVRDNLRVNFMGVLGQGYEPIIEELGLNGLVHRLGFLDYDEHLSVLKNSHATLLVLSSGERSRGWIPSKLFSYLGAGNPILALVPEGEVRDIIKRARAGLFVEPDDVDGATEALSQLYDAYAAGSGFARNESEVRKYERRHLTSLLADTLSQC